ncbi:WD40/YVTN/BNR-like repeat-containing protein [Paludibaculum fermentans]|uniref:WD40/YVTN/BNR-like repeat-containing protein n=1 Tax=Paludibaculum fermentans TaxID=1473598 RepID=UPI003EBAB3B6
MAPIIWLLLLAMLPLPLAAQYTLYTCMVTSKGYVVGAKLPPSGIFRKTPAGPWQHAGYNHPFVSALDFDPRNPSVLYVAAGNGLIQVTGKGEHWKILTGSDVTELMDVSVDRNAPADIYFSHTRGIRVTHDGGQTWNDASAGLHRKYTMAIRVDRQRQGVLLAGNEEGLFRSQDGGQSWKLAGAAGYQVLHIEQSPHDPCRWLASTQGGGLFVSTDCGVTFESNGSLAVGRNISDIAFDPTAPNRIAVAGWGLGVMLSDDLGKTWQSRNPGLPSTSVWSVAFDPSAPGRMYAGVHEEALYVSQDYGRTWTRDGLDGSRVFRLRFVPEGPQR